MLHRIVESIRSAALIFAMVLIAAGIYILSFEGNTEMLTALAIITGITLFIITFALSTPLFIGFGLLVNKPGKTRSGVHFFTFLEEGQIKVIVRGQKLVRMIMMFANHQFSRKNSGANPNDPKYWQVISIGEEEGSPIKGRGPIALWARYVYWLTGAVFTGIYPFQRVREYPVERTEIVRDEHSNITTTHMERDYSDHYRSRQFIWIVRVPKADTLDKISVDILVALKARVVNPHQSAFGIDRWDQQLTNMATNAITNFTKTRPLENVLALKVMNGETPAEIKARSEELNEILRGLDEDQTQYGIDIMGADVIDISPNLDPEERKQLYAEALAKPLAEADRITGRASADRVKMMQDVVLSGGELALEVQRTEKLVEAAKAAGAGTVLLGTTSVDPTQAAILAELRRQRKEGNS